MPPSRFEYDGRTDEPRPHLRNATPLPLVMAVGGAVLLALLLAGGLVALIRAHRAADPANGQAADATPVAFRDVHGATERPAGCGTRPVHPHSRGPEGADVARPPDVSDPLWSSATPARAPD
jgi:hypothetical protein